jgi:hypothetical protein
MPQAKSQDDTFVYNFIAAWLGGCFHAKRFSRSTLSACGYTVVGAIDHGPLSGDRQPTDADPQLLVALALSPRYRFFPIGRLIFEVGADIIIPVWKPRFRVLGNNGIVVHEPAAVVASGFVGVGWSIF